MGREVKAASVGPCLSRRPSPSVCPPGRQEGPSTPPGPNQESSTHSPLPSDLRRTGLVWGAPWLRDSPRLIDSICITETARFLPAPLPRSGSLAGSSPHRAPCSSRADPSSRETLELGSRAPPPAPARSPQHLGEGSPGQGRTEKAPGTAGR